MDYYEAPKVEQVYFVSTIKEAYEKIAMKEPAKQVCDSESGCCSIEGGVDLEFMLALGYEIDDVVDAPEESNLGLGCGNPLKISELKKGEKVLDLGSGAGFDVFLSALRVGKKGKVYGIDFSPGMIAKAKKIAEGYSNVEFLLGEMEALPLADKSVDVVISNSAINLSTDKRKVFQEAFRVLKAGGRIAICDFVALQPLDIKDNIELYCRGIAGAMTPQEIEEILLSSGFHNIEVAIESGFPGIEHDVAVGYIKARK